MSSWKVPLSLGAVALLLSGCGSIQNIMQGASESSPPVPTSSADGVPPAKVETPLEAKKALERLGIWWEGCSTPYYPWGEEGDGEEEGPIGVICGVPKAKQNDIGLGVLFTTGPWFVLRSRVCVYPDTSTQEVIVTDARTFIAFALDELDRTGDWPVEVSPIDIQKALGGQVMTIGECQKLPSFPE